MAVDYMCILFTSSRRNTRWNCDWSSDVCSSDLQEVLEHQPLAVHAADAGGAALAVDPLDDRWRRVAPVKAEHRANLRPAGGGPPPPLGVGEHPGDLLPDALRLLAQINRVAVAFRHLAAVEPRELGRRRQQGARLGEDPATARHGGRIHRVKAAGDFAGEL